VNNDDVRVDLQSIFLLWKYTSFVNVFAEFQRMILL